MTQPAWEVVEGLFHTAVTLPQEAQSQFLEEHCGSDVVLRKRVKSLLDAHRQGGDFLETTVHEAAATALRDRSGQMVGPYRLLAELGHGGMGQVYLAERADDQYSQKVAVKIVKHDLLGPGVHQRSRAERQILANLKHPGIARLLDGGATESGLPYLVMEYVDGVSIDQYCREKLLSIQERLKIFQSVCAAVAYAHRNLVVHRDLKPGNILVATDGSPRLLDFGIAKLLDASQIEESATRTSDQMMTPEYASPEQVSGGPITTATDVYALGLLLHELLTGSRAFDFKSKAASERERIIREVDPCPPSATSLQRVDKDLDHIVMKALRKEPAQRYHSAEYLSDDVGRFLDGLPVQARSGALGYRAAKFVRRRRIALSIAAVLALTVGTSGSMLWIADRRAAYSREQSQERLEAALAMANSALFDVHDSLAKMPGSTRIRALIVERTVQSLSELQRTDSSDPALSTGLAAAYEKLSDIQFRDGPGNLGAGKAAEASATLALHLRQSILKADPSNAERLGAVAADQVRLADIHRLTRMGAIAAREYREAIAVYEALPATVATAKDFRGSLADARRALATTIAAEGDANGALVQIHLALDSLRKIVSEFPRDVDARRGLERAWQTLGDIQSSYLNEYAEASKSLTEALSIARALVVEFPGQNAYRTDLASVLSTLGNTWSQAQDPGRAYPFYRESWTLVRALAVADPADARTRRSVAIHSTNLGLVLDKRGEIAEAEQLFRDSIALQLSLIEQNPENRQHPYDLAFARASLGRLLVRTGRRTDGRHELEKSASLGQGLLKIDPENLEYRLRLSRTYESLADELRSRRVWELARTGYQQAIDLLRSRHGETVPGVHVQKLAERIASCDRALSGQ